MNGGTGGTTVWKGTAFHDCEIALLHHRFRDVNGTSGECNNRAIAGQSMRVESSLNGNLYISQLEVIVEAQMIGKDIMCVHDNSTNSMTIGHRLINIGT